MAVITGFFVAKVQSGNGVFQLARQTRNIGNLATEHALFSGVVVGVFKAPEGWMVMKVGRRIYTD